MPFEFGSPLYLLLLVALLPLVWLVGRRSLAGLDAIRRRLALGLRLLVVALLVLALAEVEWRDETDQVEVVLVVDHSRSIPEGQSDLALRLTNHAQQVMDARRDRGRIVVFGRDAYVEGRLDPASPARERFVTDVAREYTNLEVALRRALEAFDPDVRGRIVLVSDGNQNLGEASAAVARARAAQVPVDVVPLEYAYQDEVLVEKVVLPNEARIGEPFLARVVVHAVSETPATIHLFQEGTLAESREVVLAPGANVEVFQLNLPAANFYRVQAVVTPRDARQDQLFQNNTAHGFVFARGKSQVLLVYDQEGDPDGAESKHLIEALRAEEIYVVAEPAVNLPLEEMALQSYDCVVLDNVEATSLSERQQRAIERAVYDMGLGLIMVGGDRSFGAGDWRGTPIEEALPVEMEIKQEEVIPDGALVMVVHSCEMPEGNAAAIKVCKKAVDGLSAKDTVGVIVYGNGEEWAVRPTLAANKGAIKDRIHNMQVGDMPDFDAVFRLALKGLEGVRASVKHMIVLSDGDPSPPAPGLLAQCRDNQITVSTICYFAHGGQQGPETQVMRRMANMTGGKYYYLQDPEQLPQIFLKESQRVARSLIVNETFVPDLRGASPILTGLDGVPALRGYVLTEAKPRAEVPMVSPESAPILAHWHHGVGRTVAFTSDARPRWASEWVRWGGFRSFWSQTVRWASKDVEESMFAVSTAVRGDRGVIVLDAVTADGQLVDGLTVVGRVASPTGDESREVRLTQRGPGRYEGDFPVTDAGTYRLSVLTTDEEGRRRHSVTTGLVFPYSDEFKRLRSNRPFLEELARQGEGRVLEPDEVLNGAVDLWDREQLSARVSLQEQWPLLLGLCAFLFLLDVAIRRVAIDLDKLWARARAVVTRRPAAPPVRTRARLRERKAAVRDREETLARFTPAAGDDGGEQVAVAGVEGEGQPARPPARKLPPRARPAEPDEDAGYTNRLLEAKRRARRGQGGEDEDQDQGPAA